MIYSNYIDTIIHSYPVCRNSGNLRIPKYGYINEAGTIKKFWDRDAYSLDFWFQHTGAQNKWSSICWSPELNLFCMVANSSAIALTSPDGVTWTQRTLPISSAWTSVCWSSSLRLFCAVSNSSDSGIAATSPDGITWTQRDTVWSRGSCVCWSPGLGMFCISNSSFNTLMISYNGISWTKVTMPTASFGKMCWSPKLNLFCLLKSGYSTVLYTSSNGSTWTSRTLPSNSKWTNICWSPELSKFCVIASVTNVNNFVISTLVTATSSDGINWVQNTPGFSKTYNDISWSPDLNKFCIVASGINFLTSSDGLNWTQGTFPVSAFWDLICWSPALKTFCVVPYNNSEIFLTSRPKLNDYI